MSKSDLLAHGWPASPILRGWWDIKTIGGKRYVYRRWREAGRMRAQYVAPLEKPPLMQANVYGWSGPRRPGRRRKE